MNIPRSITYGCVLMIALLLLVTVPGEKGLIRGYQLHQELKDLKEQNSTLRKENVSLTQEAYMLRENMAYIEHVIIQEMNLVKPGDLIVVFKKTKK
ncbi:MAG TPA: septum formation initiator family protein [Deltaproteobacteria bacterium]|nr:septum formation initiator family protein [Deltaproteobacteria bacterium]HPJ92558.1 septum formation initiator family protein [Deltaproteobacteria bacterium]HPR50822.1 septum formation initiator family protein [Deltaproteobacteria bacterium]